APVEIVADHLDAGHHVFQVARDGDFIHRIGEFAVLNPYSARAPRIIPGDHVHAETDDLGQVQSMLYRADYLRGRIAAGLQVQIGGRDARSLAHRTRGVARGSQTELARRIAVEQVGREHTLVHHLLAGAGQPLAVEWLGAKTAGNQRVVDDSNAGGGNRFAQLSD